MADIEFIMTIEDTINFGSFLFDEFDAHISIDESATETPMTVASVKEFADFISSREFCPLLFVTSAQWGGHRLYTNMINKNCTSVHYILQRYGAPAFTWLISKSFTKNDTTHLIQGFIGDYPWYYDSPESNKTIDRPRSMANAYKTISKFIRSQSVRSVCVKSGKKGPWVAKPCLEIIFNGAKLGGDGQWIIDV